MAKSLLGSEGLSATLPEVINYSWLADGQRDGQKHVIAEPAQAVDFLP